MYLKTSSIVFYSSFLLDPVHRERYHSLRGTAVAQWLRRCATIWKVAGSIPDGVMAMFH